MCIHICIYIYHKTVVAVNALSARVTEGVPINNPLSYIHIYTRIQIRRKIPTRPVPAHNSEN